MSDLQNWLKAQLTRVSGNTPLAATIRYTFNAVQAAQTLSDKRFPGIDSNAAERAIRGIAIGRKNWLFAGSERGGQSAAIAYTLIETAKLNGVGPQAWFTDTFASIPDHKLNRVDELVAWNYLQNQTL